MTNKQIVSRYCRRVSGRIPCKSRIKEPVLDRLKGEISSYLEENPQADLAEIEQRFGHPKAIAAAYVEELGIDEILDALYFRRRVIRIVACIAAALIILWAAMLTAALADTAWVNRGQGFVTEISQENNT